MLWTAPPPASRCEKLRALSTIGLLAVHETFSRGAIILLTWGGLRGGISVALALSLPASDFKAPILAATYAVVVFSIIVQGLTMKPLVARLVEQEAEGEAER